MRRKERNITDKAAMEAVIRSTFYTTLAMPDGEFPYILPLNFGYDGENIYLHCAKAGRKLDILRAAGGSLPVSLLFVSKASLLDKGQPVACSLSARYASVIVTGRLQEMTDPAERLHGLRTLVLQAGASDRPFAEKDMATIVMLKVSVASMVGKANDPA